MSFSDLNSNDWPNLIYVSLLLVFLMSSVIFKSKLKTSVLIKQALSWVTIVLIIIIIYSFRFDLYKLKNRILTEIDPSRATKISNDQVAISISNDGHFYIDLRINNNLVRFMIDTGASDIVLSVDDAKAVGIDMDKLSFSKQYQTANGVIFGAKVILKEVKVADLVFNNVVASVNNSNMGTSLLGMRFLNKFKKYEFYQDRLVLTY